MQLSIAKTNVSFHVHAENAQMRHGNIFWMGTTRPREPCQTEKEVANQACCLTQLHYTDTRPTSVSVDPTMPDVQQDSH